ncbi:MAG: type IV toxin-antitoxin system AbiEi family antitoxin domain-containing protein [Coriobacteriia bacterium]|nr:type IV toxin-antitoxin system AbiEi family antitoxin domain-containing protein [Coriobacteriia bacterium]
MRLAQFTEFAAEFPVFTVDEAATELELDPRRVREQLSRWRARGYVHRIGPGLWILDPLSGGERLDAPMLAHILDPDSAISTESALAYHGMIPRLPWELTCVTHGRPRRVQTPYGPIRFRRMAPHLWFDYEPFEYEPTCFASMATPNKALLDIFHYVPSDDLDRFIWELELGNWAPVEPWELMETARAHYSRQVVRTAQWVCAKRRGQTGEPDTLPTAQIRRTLEIRRLRDAWDEARRAASKDDEEDEDRAVTDDDDEDDEAVEDARYGHPNAYV